MAGVYTDQRLNLSKLGKAFGRKPRFQTGPGKSGRPGLYGGFGKRKPWWDCEPVLQSKRAGAETPHLQRGAPDFYPSGPQFKTDATSGEGFGDWATYQLRKLFRNCRRRCTRKRRQKPAIASTRCTTRSAARTSWLMRLPSAAPTRAHRE